VARLEAAPSCLRPCPAQRANGLGHAPDAASIDGRSSPRRKTPLAGRRREQPRDHARHPARHLLGVHPLAGADAPGINRDAAPGQRANRRHLTVDDAEGDRGHTDRARFVEAHAAGEDGRGRLRQLASKRRGRNRANARSAHRGAGDESAGDADLRVGRSRANRRGHSQRERRAAAAAEADDHSVHVDTRGAPARGTQRCDARIEDRVAQTPEDVRRAGVAARRHTAVNREIRGDRREAEVVDADRADAARARRVHPGSGRARRRVIDDEDARARGVEIARTGTAIELGAQASGHPRRRRGAADREARPHAERLRQRQRAQHVAKAHARPTRYSKQHVAGHAPRRHEVSAPGPRGRRRPGWLRRATCPPTAGATGCGPRRTRRWGTGRDGTRAARRRSDGDGAP
jgi:hypothetical protein